MDDSWRIPMGFVVPRRRSTEGARRQPRGAAIGSELGPDDFRDVFGGPPRTVLLRRFSGEWAREGETIYDEILGAGDRGMAAVARGGRRLPGFRIPAAAVVRTEEGFYDDIFGSETEESRSKSKLKSKSKSKSNSTSSVLSSEEVSPPVRHKMADDAGFSSFASKLRPIIIPTRGQNTSPPSTFSTSRDSGSRSHAATQPCPSSCFIGPANWAGAADLLRQPSGDIGFSYCFSPPDTISLEPSFRRRSQKIQAPGGSIASDTGSEGEAEKVVMEVEEEKAESLFVIEMDSHSKAKDAEGAAAVDEAIAWAKEKFWSQPFNESKATEEDQPCHKQKEDEESRGNH